MLTGKKVLAIDDTPSIRTFLRILLKSQNADIYEAETGKAGLQICGEVKPELVVLDLGLPDMDGLDVLTEIRKHSGKDSPRVVILTVRKEMRTKDKAFELGANAYITKPFIMDELLDVLKEQMQ